MPVAVANALPLLKDAAALVTRCERGAGVAELVDCWLASDLADVDEANLRQQVRLAAALDGDEGPGLALVPLRQSLLLTGASGGGKTTLITGLLEQLAESDFQFVVMDLEGDYEDLGNAVAIGSAQAAPRTEEVLGILRKAATSVAVNLLGVALPDRPGYLANRLPELLALRQRTGRPHFIVVDEAHHMLPATWDPGSTALPRGLKGFLFVTPRPESLSPRALDCVDRAMAVGDDARAALAGFAQAHSLPEPDGANGIELGEALTLSLSDPAPRRFKVIPGTTALRRHLRKYAEGTLGDDRAFFFRGPEGKLRLRATNLIMFLDLADRVDDATWKWQRERGDFSGWIETSIKDAELSAAVREIEQGASKADEARRQIRDAIERCYTLPA